MRVNEIARLDSVIVPKKAANCMLSRLNVASLGLLVGAVGQAVLYSNLSSRIPRWAILVPLYIPWLTVYAISFCRQPPCGPRRFRDCLIFAMSWYVAMAFAAEVLTDVLHPVLRDRLSLTLGRMLMCAGALTFIVLIRACHQINRYIIEGAVASDDKC